MRHYKCSERHELTWIRHVLTKIAHRTEFLASLSKHGFEAPQIQAGLALLDTIETLQAAQKLADSHLSEINYRLHITWNATDAQHYAIHRRLAHLASNLTEVHRYSLRLNQPKPEQIDGWVRQAKAFYLNALANQDILCTLSQFQIMRGDLEDGYFLTEAVEALKVKQERAKAEVQRIARERDAAFRMLDLWLAHFRQVSNMALAGDPQRWEALLLGTITASSNKSHPRPSTAHFSAHDTFAVSGHS